MVYSSEPSWLPGHNDVLTVCEAVFAEASRAQSLSAAIQTKDGIVFRLPVPGQHPYKVCSSSAGPRMESVLPYP